MRILFVCSENRLRSPTAARIFNEYDGFEAMSAGTNPTAARPLSQELVEWADAVLVMENAHRRIITERFPDAVAGKKLAVLDIPDVFQFMDQELVRMLTARVAEHVAIGKEAGALTGRRK